MNSMKPGFRIKYYRNILGISQHQLAQNCISVPMIHYIESNKRTLTIPTATIIVNKLNEIASKKGLNIALQLNDLLMPDIEYAKKFCLKELSTMSNENFILGKYLQLIDIANYYSLNDVLININEKLFNYYYEKGNYVEAIKYLQQQYELKSSSSDFHLQANVLCKIGTCYYILGQYDNSIVAYSQSYKLYKSKDFNDVNLLIKLLYNLALCNTRLNKFQEALDSVDIMLDLQLNEVDRIDALILKAGILIKIKRYEEALSIYENLVNNDYDNIYIIQNNMGYALKCLGKFKESIQYFTNSINNQIKTPNRDTTLTLIGIADAYRKESNFKISITFYQYAIKNSLDFCQYDEVIECCEHMYNIYKEQSNVNLFFSFYYNLLEYCKNKIGDDNLYKRLEYFRISKFDSEVEF